ncbi:TIGR02147 family protein [Fibrobacter sp. UWCM]|uniref:TIGR02147 family protein n=1 Tax=Fibrobacter sp. UWCM TaxID=1896208 RepID=UPI000913070B|nr:TIGR02147 family protein [Fibrobacter sp. UWCM]SHG84076.1 TIGR02147 family protein [Fibrobacter sp. UWCM]
MKDIFEYTGYRQYIADFYAERKVKSAFTWREFARMAGFSSSVHLKYVSEGRFNLGEDAVERVAKAMGLSGNRLEYFRAMVEFDHAVTDNIKKEIFDRMLSIAKQSNAKVIEGDAFRYFDSWKNPVLRELAPAMPGAKPLALAKACRPKVTAAEVSESLNFLVKANLLLKDANGNYVQTDKFVTTGPMEAAPVAIRGLHRQMGEIALDAIEGVPQNERHFSGVTLGITRNAYDKIVAELDACRRKIIEIATAEDETDEVYRLNLQFFPMTNKQSLNKKG